MPSWRESLCRHYGLCSQPVKLFKRRVNSIHQIVWNCEEISKTIWPPNVCVLFVRWDTLVSVLLPAGDRPCSFVARPIRERGSFVPTFHALRSKLRPSPKEQNRSIKARRNWPKTLWFCGILVFFSAAPDLCFSHKFLQRMEKHVCGSRSHDTHLGRERRCEIPGHKMFRAS